MRSIDVFMFLSVYFCSAVYVLAKYIAWMNLSIQYVMESGVNRAGRVGSLETKRT